MAFRKHEAILTRYCGRPSYPTKYQQPQTHPAAKDATRYIEEHGSDAHAYTRPRHMEAREPCF